MFIFGRFRINSRPSGIKELAVKELFCAAACLELILSLEELYMQPRPLAIGSPLHRLGGIVIGEGTPLIAFELGEKEAIIRRSECFREI